MRIAVVFALVALLSGKAIAAEPLDVFFLAVGSGSYVDSEKAGPDHLHNIPGATKSAKAVAELLRKGGAKFGMTLVSDERHFVSEDDIDRAFPVVWDAMVKAKTSRPLVVVYIAAHGIANGQTWDQFVLPGNFSSEQTPQDLVTNHTIELAKRTVFVPSIVEYLNGWRVPFIVILDTCYEGDEYKYKWTPGVPDIDAPCPPNDIISFCSRLNMAPLRVEEKQRANMEAGLNQMFMSYRESNKFKNTFPVMFSAEPGKSVQTVADPWDSDPRVTAVAPLARRMMIVLPKALDARAPLTLGSFIRQMTSPALDAQTGPAIMYSTVPSGSDDSYIVDNLSAGTGVVEARFGTATTPAPCCSEP